jgi:hypothetical protein
MTVDLISKIQANKLNFGLSCRYCCFRYRIIETVAVSMYVKFS